VIIFKPPDAVITPSPYPKNPATMERAAVARAIVNKPPILLADEPTGNLDSRNSNEVMHLLQQLNAEGATVIMVTHSAECAGYANRRIEVRDGRIVAQ